jgi:hypothetical protein
MAYIRTQEGDSHSVPVTFVQACGLLRNMTEVFGDETTDDPIPLPTITAAQLREVLRFDSLAFAPCVLEDHLQAKSALDCLDLWRLADYLDHEPLEQALVAHLADLIRYSEPARVMELFQIQQPPTDEELQSAVQRYPFLQEN